MYLLLFIGLTLVIIIVLTNTSYIFCTCRDNWNAVKKMLKCEIIETFVRGYCLVSIMVFILKQGADIDLRDR